MAGGIAHDFNNILTAILGYSEMILMQIDESKPIWNDVREIQSAGERAASLTANCWPSAGSRCSRWRSSI